MNDPVLPARTKKKRMHKADISSEQHRVAAQMLHPGAGVADTWQALSKLALEVDVLAGLQSVKTTRESMELHLAQLEERRVETQRAREEEVKRKEKETKLRLEREEARRRQRQECVLRQARDEAVFEREYTAWLTRREMSKTEQEEAAPLARPRMYNALAHVRSSECHSANFAWDGKSSAACSEDER
ncbi:hypothetical protein EXIGLDRAFT_730335 [Exidia glandulosa HHB12029]|uniref:Uncharacterized protein n=1 Tax=Exidia glandulosa HHB12029 TaxID=1314781 RepID=A0A165C7Q9_EXIGL|nr:hypothetical protein EXIGLDRAFT_730335 [Exidia glandulosa HHB12029]